jgi:small-conductance mechanosensitive channel
MSAQSDMPKVGIARAVAALGNYRFKDLIWPEGLPALLVGAGGTAVLVRVTTLTARTSAVSTLVGLTGVLLAVVFAALAIVVAIPTSRYLRALAETRRDERPSGFQRFLDPFLVAVGTQITILILALTYGLAAGHVATWIEHIAFCVIGFLFVYGLLDIGALARSLVRHGIFRSLEAGPSEEPHEGDVHQLRDRRESSS